MTIVDTSGHVITTLELVGAAAIGSALGVATLLLCMWAFAPDDDWRWPRG